MRMLTITALAFSFTALATAQMREVWRYVYMPPQSELYAHLNRAVRLADGSLLLVGWVETPTNPLRQPRHPQGARAHVHAAPVGAEIQGHPDEGGLLGHRPYYIGPASPSPRAFGV